MRKSLLQTGKVEPSSKKTESDGYPDVNVKKQARRERLRESATSAWIKKRRNGRILNERIKNRMMNSPQTPSRRSVPRDDSGGQDEEKGCVGKRDGEVGEVASFGMRRAAQRGKTRTFERARRLRRGSPGLGLL